MVSLIANTKLIQTPRPSCIKLKRLRPATFNDIQEAFDAYSHVSTEEGQREPLYYIGFGGGGLHFLTEKYICIYD